MPAERFTDPACQKYSAYAFCEHLRRPEVMTRRAKDVIATTTGDNYTKGSEKALEQPAAITLVVKERDIVQPVVTTLRV